MGCKKIPDLINYNDYEGDYKKYESDLYSAFDTSFGKKEYYFRGKKIKHKKNPEFQGKSCTFWHIISENVYHCEENRIPDFNRCARIKWPAFILEYCCENCKDLLIWKNKRKNKTRVLIFCERIHYIVILEERAEYYVFWTAYPITYKHREKQLKKEYEAYMINNKKF